MFLKNMGILGLQSAQGFADRLFNSFDIDNDNKVENHNDLDFIARLPRVHGDTKMRELEIEGKDIV